MIKSVIFDLDGTLIDTSEGVISSVLKTIEHFGYRELSRAELESFIGPPINKSMERHFGVSEEEGKEAVRYYREQYMAENVDENGNVSKADIYKGDIYPGMENLLQSLRDMGIKVGVATYKQEWMAKDLLEEKGLAKYFDVIHGADPEGKLTKADVVALSIKDLGEAPEETVMIGDSDNDAIGAKGAGTLFIGVSYGFGFATLDDIGEYDNIGTAETTDEVLEIIKDINR